MESGSVAAKPSPSPRRILLLSSPNRSSPESTSSDESNAPVYELVAPPAQQRRSLPLCRLGHLLQLGYSHPRLDHQACPRSQAPCQSKPLRKSSTSSKMTEMAQERNAFTSGKRMITRRRVWQANGRFAHNTSTKGPAKGFGKLWQDEKSARSSSKSRTQHSYCFVKINDGNQRPPSQCKRELVSLMPAIYSTIGQRHQFAGQYRVVLGAPFPFIKFVMLYCVACR